MRHIVIAIALCLCSGELLAQTPDEVSEWLVAGAGYADGPTQAERAFAHNLKAAEAGDAEAQYRVGYAYEYGQGVEEDKSKAKSFYEKAAAQNHGAALFSLAVLYEYGDTQTEADPQRAIAYLTRAAEAGYASAQLNLGAAYEVGLHLPKDEVLAYVWYARAAAQKEEGAQLNLDSLTARLTPDQLERAKRLLHP